MNLLRQLVERSLAPERRDPTAATRPVVYAPPGQKMIPKWDAQTALTYGYYANTFVYRCIQCIAQDLSGLPIRVGADPEKPHDYDRRYTSGLARRLSPPPYGPNPATSARQLIGWSVAQLLATGRLAWELELEGKTPIAFWPLAAPYLDAIPARSGARYFQSFEFGKPGDKRKLRAEQVFYHWRPKADDWRQPESQMEAAKLDISVAVMQDRYDHAFLKNDARPAALVIYEGFATEQEDDAFRRRFAGEFQGPDNAGKTMFVEADRGDSGVAGAIDIKTLGFTQKDARFIERYDAKLRAICVAFGVPLTRLGDASNRTFANASEEYRVYWNGLLPLISEIADAINMHLAPRFGSNLCWFDLSKVEALKPVKRFTAMEGVQLYQERLITGDELRAEIELEPLGLDFKEAPEPVPLANEQPVLEPADATDAEVVDDTGRAQTPQGAALPAATPESAGRARPAPELRSRTERRAAAVVHATVAVEALEAAWVRAFRRLFSRQAKETLARLNGKRGRQALRDVRAPEPDAVFNRRHWEEVTAEEAEDLVRAAHASGAGQVASEFGITFDLDDPYVVEFIRSRANQLAGYVTDTTYRLIQEAMAEGVSAGETIEEIAERVREVFAQASAVRAETIARTEVISAVNGSKMLTAAQMGLDVIAGTEWVAVEDERTRPRHAAADGEVVPVGHPFTRTGENIMYPGDPNGSAENTINCRCTVAFLTPDEMDERCTRVETRSALAVLSLVRAGQEFDELALRRALREVRAA